MSLVGNALKSVFVNFDVRVSGGEQLKALDSKVKALKTSANDASTAFASMEKGIRAMRASMAVFGAFELGRFFKSTIDMGASLANTAAKLGVGTDELQAFDFAAKMAGISTESAGTSLMRLNKTLGAAADGNHAAAKTFAGLGVSITGTDGKVRPLRDLIPSIAARFGKMSSEAQKTDYAVRLFGRSGAQLLPILHDGAGGLADFYRQFEAMGGGIASKDVAALKKADQQLSILGVRFDVLRAKLVTGAIPGLESLVKGVEKGFQWLGQLSDKTYLAQTALISLGAAGAIALAPMLLEIAPIVAAAGAAYLAFDDLFALFHGGNSITGTVIDAVFGKGAHITFVADVKAAFEKFLGWIKDTAIPKLRDFGGEIAQGFRAALPAIREIGSVIEEAFRLVDMHKPKSVPTGVAGHSESAIEGLPAGNAELWAKLHPTGDWGANAASDLLKFTIPAPTFGPPAPPAAPWTGDPDAMAQAALTGATFNITNQTTVNAPSGDPKAIVGAVNGALAKPDKSTLRKDLGAVKASMGGN